MTPPVHRCVVCGELIAPGRARAILACASHRSGGRWNVAFKLRPLHEEEADVARRLARGLWGHDAPYAFGRTWPIVDQECLVADAGGAVAGLVAIGLEGTVGRILAMGVPPLYQGLGVGSALLSAAIHRLRKRGAERIVLATTNDNLPALQMYQRRGFVVEEVIPGAVAEFLARRLGRVPVGFAGIPVRDEVRMRLPPRGGPEPPSA